MLACYFIHLLELQDINCLTIDILCITKIKRSLEVMIRSHDGGLKSLDMDIWKESTKKLSW